MKEGQVPWELKHPLLETHIEPLRIPTPSARLWQRETRETRILNSVKEESPGLLFHNSVGLALL